METSNQGKDFIRYHEGLRLSRYVDTGGVQTIGYGHTGKNLPHTITKAQAEEYLTDDIKTAEKAVNALKIDLTQCQYDALLDFTFNVGASKFMLSTLRKYIVARKPNSDIAKQLMRWVYDNGKVHRGLKRRRENEVNLYCNGVYVNGGV